MKPSGRYQRALRSWIRLKDARRYRWFVGMNMDEPVWDVTVFTKNRDRLLEGAVAELFFPRC